MKIAINGYFLTLSMTGIGVHLIGLLSGASHLKDDFELLVFVPKSVDFDFGPKIKIIVIPQINLPSQALSKFFWEQTLPWRIKKYKVDLIHHIHPATALFAPLPQITTFHDAIQWQCPEDYSATFSAKLLYGFIKLASRKTKHLLAVSRDVKKQMIRYLGAPTGKITVIYNAASPAFYQQANANEKILDDYKIKKPYIFYIGGFDKRKNVRLLLETFAKIAGKVEENLVLAGGIFASKLKIYQDYFDLPDLISKLGLTKRVQMLGPITNEKLPVFYQNATAFVSPTRLEGFNIPVLEAFASGTPVVCSGVSATRELAEGWAETFNPDNPAEFEKKLLKVLKSGILQSKLSKRGRERAQDFSWQKSAKELVEVYQKVVSERQK